MEILLLLIPLSVFLMGASAYAFLWAVRKRQFDQLERHALDIFDDDANKHGSAE